MTKFTCLGLASQQIPNRAVFLGVRKTMGPGCKGLYMYNLPLISLSQVCCVPSLSLCSFVGMSNKGQTLACTQGCEGVAFQRLQKEEYRTTSTSEALSAKAVYRFNTAAFVVEDGSKTTSYPGILQGVGWHSLLKLLTHTHTHIQTLTVLQESFITVTL